MKTSLPRDVTLPSDDLLENLDVCSSTIRDLTILLAVSELTASERESLDEEIRCQERMSRNLRQQLLQRDAN